MADSVVILMVLLNHASEAKRPFILLLQHQQETNCGKFLQVGYNEYMRISNFFTAPTKKADGDVQCKQTVQTPQQKCQKHTSTPAYSERIRVTSNVFGLGACQRHFRCVAQ